MNRKSVLFLFEKCDIKVDGKDNSTLYAYDDENEIVVIWTPLNPGYFNVDFLFEVRDSNKKLLQSLIWWSDHLNQLVH